ncbi:unnamed protein product [Rhizophagus irregularis]|nr:unnamed protein product [Rhizophagus irregularis]CAB5369713.1 unnamed protein product [Rhizophagus irregularis]
MAHPLSEEVRADEKREKRLNSLELRTIEVENTLLRTSKAALEKRVAELEASLKESNEECNKLKQTIAHISVKSPEKEVSSLKNIEKDEKVLNNTTNEDILDDISDVISNINKEEEIIYERILKLVENMKSDCQKAINMKIPTESQLPMRPMRQSAKSISSKSPSPDGLISPSKTISRPWTPVSIPTSRNVTPSGAISPPNSLSSHIPTKNPTSPKASHLPSRSNTPSGNHYQSNSVNSIQNNSLASSLNKKQRPRTGSCCSNIPSRPHTPPPANIHPTITTGIPSGLSSGIPSKLQQCRRTVTC